MQTLGNSRHELFCLGLVEGKTATQAYADAGYNPNDDNAIRLKGNERVVARVEELHARQLLRHDVTVDTLTDELEEARLLAHQEGQAGAAVSAIMGVAKLHGLLTDKVEHSKGSLANILAEIDGRTRGLTQKSVDCPMSAPGYKQTPGHG